MKRLKDGAAESHCGGTARGTKPQVSMRARPSIMPCRIAFERASAVTKKKLLETALIHSYGKASVEDMRNAALRDAILQKEKNGRRYVTTRDVLQEEQRHDRFRTRRAGHTRQIRRLRKPSTLDPQLSDEQRGAALTLLNSRDKVTGLKGRAGTGKTTMMRATIGGH